MTTRRPPFWLLLSASLAGLCLGNDGQPIPCGSLTCQNAAICVEDAPNFESHRMPDGSVLDIHSQESDVHCSCHPGWTGVSCDVEFRSCDGTKHKCYHGGECVLGLIDMYDNEQLYCNCDNAMDEEGNRYVGKYCEEKSMDFCDPDDQTRYCLNSGTCNSQYPDVGKSCICPEGFKGPHCEYKADTVPDCTMDCQNGGHCILGTPDTDNLDDFSAYFNIVAQANERKQYCHCAPGFYGQFCEVESEPCGEGKCFYGSKCTESSINSEINHHCDCRYSNTGDTSYAGRFCQYEATTYCDKGRDGSVNGHLFCVNNGTCQADEFSGCKCPTGYRGFSCEYFVAEDLPPEHVVANHTSPFDPVGETSCDLDCNGRGTCRDGIKDIDDEVVGAAEHLGGNETQFEHCVCQHGWTGLHCEHEAVECGGGSHYCFHGGQCYTGGDEKMCDCSVANSTELGTSVFGGDQCEHPATDICTKQTDGQVTVNEGLSFCVNFGTCKAMVEEGEAHPGCNCDETKWTGPHCEVKVSPPDLAPPLQGDDDSSSKRSPFEVIVILAIVFVAVTFILFTIYQSVKNRQERLHKPDRTALRLRETQSGYRDEPNINEQVNLSPRRSSSIAEDRETADVASAASSRDPFASHLAAVAPPPLLNTDYLDNSSSNNNRHDDDGPQVYLGPPQDEDGNVLHSVEII